MASQVKNIADNSPATTLTWTPPAALPGGWSMANQYIEFDFQPITAQNSAGIPGSQGAPDTQGNFWETRIYTDNTGSATGSAAFPQWQESVARSHQQSRF